MPLSRQQKESLSEAYEKGLASAPHIFLLDFKGITVPEDTELRSRIRGSGGNYEVIKNRILLRSIGGKPLEELREHFSGPTAAAYSEQDPVALAKALTEFAKTVPAIEFKAGMVEGRAIRADEIKEIAALPSRDELLAKLLFLLQAPISGLARVLGAIPQQFVAVLGQIGEHKEKQGPAS
jgi:large subunit ribosomal protein L10